MKKSRLIDNLLDILIVGAVSITLTVAGVWGGYAHTTVIGTKAPIAGFDDNKPFFDFLAKQACYWLIARARTDDGNS